MMRDDDDLNLGDLPNDIGTDHNQLIDVPPGMVSTDPAGKRKRAKISVPAWSRWLAGVLVPHLFGGVRFTARPFTTKGNSFELTGGKTNRRYLFIQNLSAGSMYINFDNEASADSGILLITGAAYEPFRVPKNSIYIAGSAADLKGFIVEG